MQVTRDISNDARLQCQYVLELVYGHRLHLFSGQNLNVAGLNFLVDFTD